jgi:hypothetical protein
MEMSRVALSAGVLIVAGCAAAPVETGPVAPAQPAPPPADARAIPARTLLDVRLDQELGTTASRVGDTFTATVEEPLIAANRQTVVPAGAVITGMVTGVGPVAEGQEVAAIRLNFLRINIDGVSHPVSASIVGTRLPGAAQRPGDETQEIVTAAAAGAVLGAILGGELRDMLVGAALGAGAGTVISLGTGEAEAVLPAGTQLRLQTVDRVQLR